MHKQSYLQWFSLQDAVGSQKGALRACNGKVIEKEGTFEIREDNFLSVQLGRPRPGEGQDLPVSYNKEVAEAGLSPRCPDPKPSLSPLPIRLLWRRTQQWSAHVHTKITHAPAWSFALCLENTHLFHARAWQPEQDAYLTADFSQLFHAIIESAIFLGPFPFLLLLSFLLMPLSYRRQIARPYHLIIICKGSMFLFHPFWGRRTCLDLVFILT